MMHVDSSYTWRGFQAILVETSYYRATFLP